MQFYLRHAAIIVGAAFSIKRTNVWDARVRARKLKLQGKCSVMFINVLKPNRWSRVLTVKVFHAKNMIKASLRQSSLIGYEEK